MRDSATPTVSVVIPCHNRSDLLRRALQSVRSQTFSDWELVVVDDGSQENIVEVVQSIGDSRMRAIRHEPRGGAARARNIGIRASRGEWIAFLDSDDEWRPARLERQMEAIHREQSANVRAGYCLVDELDYTVDKFRPRVHPSTDADILDLLLRRQVPLMTSAYMVKRDALLEVGGFDELLPSTHDFDLWLRLAQAGCRFAGIQDALVVMHRHTGARISNNPIGRLKGFQRFHRKWRILMRKRLGADGYWDWRRYRSKKLRRLYWDYIRNELRESHLSRALRASTSVAFFLPHCLAPELRWYWHRLRRTVRGVVR